MARTILKLNASARQTGSVSRDLVETLTDHLSQAGAEIVTRDVGLAPPSIVDEAWVGANFTPDEERTDAQRAALAESDTLVAELEAADTIVLGVPIYNFGVPAAFKAWIDQVTRARKTFAYTKTGPVGLLKDKKAYVVVASGGTPVDSEVDFATPYIRFALGFIGITDVDVIAADQLFSGGPELIERAEESIRAIAA